MRLIKFSSFLRCFVIFTQNIHCFLPHCFYFDNLNKLVLENIDQFDNKLRPGKHSKKIVNSINFSEHDKNSARSLGKVHGPADATVRGRCTLFHSLQNFPVTLFKILNDSFLIFFVPYAYDISYFFVYQSLSKHSS